MDGALKLARIVDEIRGGAPGSSGRRDAAIAVWPQAPSMITSMDSFCSATAKDAVLRGMTTVVFGGAGFPFGEHPHAAAARASKTAAFRYCSASSACHSRTAGRRRS